VATRNARRLDQSRRDFLVSSCGAAAVLLATNARAPLADDYFGYLSDAHTGYGRYFYIDLKIGFGQE